MNTKSAFLVGGLSGLVLLASGCASTSGTSATNPSHPGPAIGQAVGQTVGVVGGNVAGAVYGAGEGLVDGVRKPFTNEVHVVRVWHTETTSDGRTVQVPQDILVDQYGRPVSK